MSALLPTCLSWLAFSAVTKSAQYVFCRALMTLNGHPSLINFDHLNYVESRAVDLSPFAQLQQHDSPHTPYLLNKIISQCAKSADLDTGLQLHSPVVKLGLTSNVYICSALVHLYGECSQISSAQKIFDDMPERNAVTWSCLICGYLQAMRPEVATGLFLEMLRGGITPTPNVVSAVLVGCAQMESGELGSQMQGLSLKHGFCSNVVVATNLVDMYAKCSKLDESRRFFDQMPERNVITWTGMITGYAQNELPSEAMILFREMRRLGLELNYVTINSLLSSFSGAEHIDHCKQIHSNVIREGFESNSYIQATLLTVYSEFDCSLEDFHKICSGISQWNQISWNAVIAGFSRLECGKEALECFFDMRRKGICADFFTLSSILRAVGIISALEVGQQTHAIIFKMGYASHVQVQNGLVSMYNRCGMIHDAKKVFFAMERHDLTSWNSLLWGCAYHGYGSEVVKLFEEMKSMGIQPDGNTILSVLSACSHTGLLEKGLEYFKLFRELDFHGSLTLEHYASLVDLFGRAGYLQEAEAVMNSMSMQPGPSMYKSLISACNIHGNMDIAYRASQQLLELYPNDSSTYVLLSSSLAIEGCWNEAAGIRKLMQDRRVQKHPGYSQV
ncbi:hypothetical protein Ancab_011593 [Ancistrocladus abbreviatus]